jgi:very-short-patch-repair endonuclease
MHADEEARDARRDHWLENQGIRTLRFSIEELERRPAVVLATIQRAAAPSTA